MFLYGVVFMKNGFSAWNVKSRSNIFLLLQPKLLPSQSSCTYVSTFFLVCKYGRFFAALFYVYTVGLELDCWASGFLLVCTRRENMHKYAEVILYIVGIELFSFVHFAQNCFCPSIFLFQFIAHSCTFFSDSKLVFPH